MGYLGVKWGVCALIYFIILFLLRGRKCSHTLHSPHGPSTVLFTYSEPPSLSLFNNPLKQQIFSNSKMKQSPAAALIREKNWANRRVLFLTPKNEILFLSLCCQWKETNNRNDIVLNVQFTQYCNFSYILSSNFAYFLIFHS